MIIYHGSPQVVVPRFGLGKDFNDYGRGLYCTENPELSKEWACSQDTDGYANCFDLNIDGLSVLNLNAPEINILNWLAILLDNRKFSIAGGLPAQAKSYILDNFLLDYRNYDIIRGNRADDSYFAFAKDFVNNSLSLKDLKRAMELGGLGEQIVIKSHDAFDAITVLAPIPADRNEYFAKYSSRDLVARTGYQDITFNPSSDESIYIIDIIRNGIKNGDPRI